MSIAPFCERLRLNDPELSTLHLFHVPVGDEGARHLADSLKSNTVLTTLNLRTNDIGAEGAQHIADALKTNTVLTTLQLRDNRIGAYHASAYFRSRTVGLVN